VISAEEHDQRAVAHVEKAKRLLERIDPKHEDRTFTLHQMPGLAAAATAHGTLALYHQREAERRQP
jgi:hypothetical protein